MKSSSILLFSLLSFFISSQAWAAACCGGGIALPALISGDDRALLSTAYTYGETVVDSVDSSGVWRKWDEHQKTQTLRIEGSHIFHDRWQAGAAVPFMERRQLDEKSSGLGDVTATLGYEYLTDWDYHPYRPKGLGFVELVLPTGKSRAESEMGGLDSRGNGFWALGLGSVLSKTFSRWDALVSLEGHRSFKKNVDSSQLHGELRPGFGGSFGFGVGYSRFKWRLGGSILWSYEDPVNLRGNFNSDGTPERYATAVVSLAHDLSDEWGGVLSYADQTLFGNPVNTSLGRSVTLLFQRHFSR